MTGQTTSQAQRISDAKYQAGAEFERTSKQYTRALVPPDRPLVILDIGCGVGVNAQALAEMGHTVHGVDISSVAIEKFRANGFEGWQCDVTEGIPCADGKFDLVFASEVIEHVADSERFLAEVRRVLRPGGTLLLSTPNSAFWIYRVLSTLGLTLSEIQHPGHLRFFSRRGLARTVKEAGFEKVQVAGRNMYLLVPDRLGKALAPLLRPLGFRREHRFKSGKDFWHLSRFASRASPWWADTLILRAQKSELTSA